MTPMMRSATFVRIVYVKDKGGSGPGEFTGIKLNTLQ